MREIKDMSVLITGGGSGIGEGAARHFAGKGALVTISGRREEPLRSVEADIGDRCRVVVGDVTVSVTVDGGATAVEGTGVSEVVVVVSKVEFPVMARASP